MVYIPYNVNAQNNQKQALPWIGVDVLNITQPIANVLDMNNNLGTIITKIYPNSPAESSGLYAGNKRFLIDNSYMKLDADVITKVDDTIISNARQFNALINNKEIGENLTLSILRDEQIITIVLTVGSTTNYVFENASVYANPDNVDFIKYEDMKSKIKIQKPIKWNLRKR